MLLVFFQLTFLYPSYNQDIVQTLKGTVTDLESGKPLAGAYIITKNSISPGGTTADNMGRFWLTVETGRITIKFSHIGYEDLILNDVLVTSGKEVTIDAKLREKVISTNEVIIRSDRRDQPAINQMASVSTHTIRTEDALHYAGGFYDPSRIVNSLAGIVTANNDDSNDLIIRGNSSRGLLWRLEGIEIPNPNHFSDGFEGSGGAFSSITSNVIANFDFFTGAFPAEFGNAFSGVMDLNLRKGNSDKREYAFQTGMIGAEVSAEGPFKPGTGASYLINARYTNFKILSDLNLIDLGETNYAPRTSDLVFNINIPGGKKGNLNIFGFNGSSKIGRLARRDYYQWSGLSDQWEEMEKQSSGIIGAKHYLTLPGSGTYIRSVMAFTRFSNSYFEGYVDSSYSRSDSYFYDYSYPSLRYALLVNHKLNASNTFRAGLNYNYLTGKMGNYRLNTGGTYDTLVAPSDQINLIQSYFQWKFRTVSGLEINSGIHILHFSRNEQTSIEPRFGMRWQITPGNSFTTGIGLHTRTESLAAYNSLVKNADGIRSSWNSGLELAKSFHIVTGLDLSFREDIRFLLEGYLQFLFDIPIINKITSQYSTLNSAVILPDAVLENKGTGRNTGIELTIEKTFTRNYYYLITGSLYNSWYIAGDHKKYNTFHNTRFMCNILAGKDFYIGKNKRNIVGINSRLLTRGGYRYTPVDEKKTIKAKRIILMNTASYEKQLPAFIRIDGGISYRRNYPNLSWIIILDVQNVTGRRNVFKRRFTYENGKILTNDVLSLGAVPVFNFRVEF